MHIAIDVTPIENAHAKRGTGIYTKNLVEALKQYEKEHSYSFFTRKQNISKNTDLVHYPYFDPFFLTLPLQKVKPSVVTVHDLIPLVFPDKFPAGIRGSIKWQIQKTSLKGAKRIITDSKSSKKDISRIVPMNANNIDVIYLAPSIKPKEGRISGLPDHFILYVGDVNWNKNVLGLLEAVGDKTLVLAGKSFLDNKLPETIQINRLIESLGLEKKIIRLGFVENLAALYSQADCLVMPSFYEGFGLPALEAMTCSCPVVVADNSSLSEIAGPSVRVSTEPESIKKGIDQALKQKKKLIKEGLEWVKRFTWKKVAHETVSSYEKVLASV